MGVMHEPTAGEYAASEVYSLQRKLASIEQRLASLEAQLGVCRDQEYRVTPPSVRPQYTNDSPRP